MRRSASFLLPALLLALLPVAHVAAQQASPPANPPAGTPVEPGPEAAPAGATVADEPPVPASDDPDATDVVQTVATVDCAEPHDNEIFFEFSMTDASFPGREATVAAAGERCVAEFDGFVGLSYQQSDLDLFPITPTAESWTQGDRVVYCALYALDLSKLTGSMRGAAR